MTMSQHKVSQILDTNMQYKMEGDDNDTNRQRCHSPFSSDSDSTCGTESCSSISDSSSSGSRNNSSSASPVNPTIRNSRSSKSRSPRKNNSNSDNSNKSCESNGSKSNTICSANANKNKKMKNKNNSSPKTKNNNRKKRTNASSSSSEVSLAKETLTFEEMNQYVAIDCEMVGVGYEGHSSVVARVTIIDWNGKILLDEYIKPSREITDYRTFVSGIKPQHLEQAKYTMEECREVVMNIINNKIVVGHALKNDLQALHIQHPWYMIRDTAKYEPFMKIRFDDGVLWPRKLKELVSEKLSRNIQLSGMPHSAYEDALAALDLYRLVRRKWEKAMDYKINKTKQIQKQKEQEQVSPHPQQYCHREQLFVQAISA